MEFIENGEVVHKKVDTIFFSFRDINKEYLKYHFNSEYGEFIYNGTKSYQSINNEKIILTSEDNSPKSVNSPLLMTIYQLKHILPRLIKNKEVKISRKNDTIINGNTNLIFSFLLEKKYIDWINYEFKEGIDYDSEYLLIVDKTNYLPYKIISTNGKQGLISRTIENIELDTEYDNKVWSGEYLPNDYAKFTEEEYYSNLDNNMTSNIGKKLTNWELPELNNDSFVNPSKLIGNIILLEFWFKNCGGCIKAIPSLNEIKTRFENYNFKIYGVEFEDDNSKENLEKYIIDQKILYPTLYKGKKIALDYGIKSAPTFMIIDKYGKIIHLKSGFSVEHMNEIINIIDRNL